MVLRLGVRSRLTMKTTSVKTNTWSLGQAQNYVATHAEVLGIEPIRAAYTAARLRCIDGRHSGDHRGEIGFPGGSLGAAFAALAAIDSLAHKGGRVIKLSGREVLSVSEEIFQGVSCHSDTHHPHDPNACRGCGHCYGAMAEDTHEAYKLGRFLEEAKEYAQELRTRAEAGESHVYRDMYDLDHREGAVLYILDDLSRGKIITVPGTYGDGSEQTFVFHAVVFEDILKFLGAELFQRFPSQFEKAGMSEQALQTAMRDVGTQQVLATAGRLADGKPTYYVFWKGDGITVSDSDPRAKG